MRRCSIGYRACGAPAGTPSTVIVRSVNRSVLAGQRIGILGANGQGKSTLVKTIARALPPLGGRRSPRARAWTSATSRSRSWTCCARTTRR
ncbi:MAG: ATP-binding cassette domain-containing protein [Comamonadaceae bacterium]|nr:ATP-binding cassette domain-containing protein [Comamonadaceae bacterium]